MSASPLAEAIILAHDVYAKRKEGDEALIDVVRREVGEVQARGGSEDDIALAWLSRVDAGKELDVLMQRFPEHLVERLVEA